MLKILLCINGLGSGGAEVLVVSLARELAKRHDVMVVTYAGCIDSKGQQLREELAEAGIKYLDLNARTWMQKLRVPFRLASIIKHHFQPDVVHAHLRPMTLACSLARVLSMGKTKARFYWTKHSARPIKKNFENWFVGKVYDAAIGCASPVTKALANHYPKLPVVNINNGIPLPPLRGSKSVAEPGRFTAVLIGRFAALAEGLTKGQDYIVEHLAASPIDKLQVRFIGGGPPLASEKQRAAELGLIDNQVVYVGVVDNVLEEIGKADLYLSASLVEGMPIAVLEALLSGLPAILPDIPEFQIFKHDAVIIYNRDEPDGMVSALRKCMGNYGWYAEQALINAEALRKEYSIANCAENHERLYMLGSCELVSKYTVER